MKSLAYVFFAGMLAVASSSAGEDPKSPAASKRNELIVVLIDRGINYELLDSATQESLRQAYPEGSEKLNKIIEDIRPCQTDYILWSKELDKNGDSLKPKDVQNWDKKLSTMPYLKKDLVNGLRDKIKDWQKEWEALGCEELPDICK